MFRELVQLAQTLRSTGKEQMPPIGFYRYREPIRWIIHLWPGRIYIQEAELNLPRPFDGRTSAIRAHPLVDEAGYALGVDRQEKGSDSRAVQKHRAFRDLILQVKYDVQDAALREAIDWLITALDSRLIASDPRFQQIKSKDWVSFVAGEGPLAGRHLYQHPEVLRFWAEELARRKEGLEFPILGECAVCGQKKQLVHSLPKVRVTRSPMPMHSLNADAFVSYIGGAGVAEKSYLRICFACGEEAAVAFNYLSDSEVHHRNLVRLDPEAPDGLSNMIALFWLRAPAPLKLAGETVDPADLRANLARGLGSLIDTRPGSDTRQVLNLLQVPWQPHDAALTLDDYAFYLAVISPNKARLVVREWISVSLEQLRTRLRRYLDALRRPYTLWRLPSITEMVSALAKGDPNLPRALLRTAFLGHRPPQELKVVASNRLKILTLKGTEQAQAAERRLERKRQRSPNSEDRERQQEVLLAILNLALFYGKEEGEIMSYLANSPAYLCGRLLAVLEAAQQRAQWAKGGGTLDSTIVQRFYGTASTAPAAAFATLLRLATTAHLPDAGIELNRLVEEIISKLKEVGGFPKTLNADQQAEFHLGFFSQRAELRATK